MVVLSRQINETIMIGDDIFVTCDAINPTTAEITICAPAELIESISGSLLRRRSNAATALMSRDNVIRIGNDISVVLVDIRGDKARIGLTVPHDISIHRKEVYDAIKNEMRGDQ